MKMLSLPKWAQKVERLAQEYGIKTKYVCAELVYNSHKNTGSTHYMYTIYVADVISPTISGSDWKLLLKEAQVIIRKKGYKKITATTTNTNNQ